MFLIYFIAQKLISNVIVLEFQKHLMTKKVDKNKKNNFKRNSNLKVLLINNYQKRTKLTFWRIVCKCVVLINRVNLSSYEEIIPYNIYQKISLWTNVNYFQETISDVNIFHIRTVLFSEITVGQKNVNQNNDLPF